MASYQASQGTIKSVSGADPAATGAECLITVPADKRWRIIALAATLVTDANAANRVVSFVITDSADVVLARSSPGANHAASTTVRYHAANYGYAPTSPLLTLPVGMILGPGMKIKTSTTLVQATDNYGVPTVLVEEWDDSFATGPQEA